MTGHLDVIHEDADLVAIHKPHRLLSQPGRGPEKIDSVATRARAIWPDARVVHRLDRDTSGVMVLARGPEAHRRIARQLEARQVEKTYLAQVWGEIAGASGCINLPLRKDMEQRLPPRHVVDHDRGKAASTTWRRLACGGGRSRLEVRPITGRSHQIRVHLQAIGHAVLGDPIYAGAEGRDAADRLLLHALALTLRHPADGRPITFTAPCPF